MKAVVKPGEQSIDLKQPSDEGSNLRGWEVDQNLGYCHSLLNLEESLQQKFLSSQVSDQTIRA